MDLFCGACNVIEGITTASARYANDINPYLVLMYQSLVYDGWQPPTTVDQSIYNYHKQRKPLTANTGFYGCACSFAGKWYGGLARTTGVNYAQAGHNALLKQKPLLQGVTFSSLPYNEYKIPNNAVVYCDIPYDTPTSQSYFGAFSRDSFFSWVDKNKDKYQFFISEYQENVQDMAGYEVVWARQHKQRMAGNKQKTDVIITPKR